MIMDEEEEPSSESESELDVPKDDHIHARGEFYGCYLLVSKNPKYTGRTYIGFTVNPNRRLRQHNSGHQRGGARKTSGRGPWDMILIIHGFPSNIAALRFEWAWQHPNKSRRLGPTIAKKLSKETALQHKLRVVSHMLRTPPWCRLPLTVRWLKQEYECYFTAQNQPPLHMPIAYGLVDIQAPVRREKGVDEANGGSQRELSLISDEQLSSQGHPQQPLKCSLCAQTIDSAIFTCYHQKCSFSAHCTCLAPRLCESNHLLPISGPCPQCTKDLLWGELVRQYNASSISADDNIQQSGVEHQLQSQTDCQPPHKRRKGPAKESHHWTEALHVGGDC